MLSKKNMASIVQTNYSSFGVNLKKTVSLKDNLYEFGIIDSTHQLPNYVKKFQTEVNNKNSTRARLLLIIHLDNKYWATFMLGYKNNNYEGYYIDPRATLLPPEDFQFLLTLIPTLHDLNIQQLRDGLNGGVLALENANNLNYFFNKDGHPSKFIDQLMQYTSEYLREKKETLLSNLPVNTRKIARHPSDEAATKERLDIFVENFIKRFTMKIGAYRLTAKDEKLTVRALLLEIETGVTGCVVGAMIAASPAGCVPSAVASARSLISQYIPKRRKAKKISKAFDKILQPELEQLSAEAGIKIFQSFEKQFAALTDDALTLEKLAADAVDRALNYIAVHAKDNNPLSSDLITQGVVLGPSKKHFSASLAKRRPWFSGRKLKTFNGETIQTADLYRKTGLVVIKEGEPHKFYRRSATHPSVRDEYRRLLAWEKEQNGALKEAYQDKYLEETQAQASLSRDNYFLQSIDIEEEAKRIQKKMKSQLSKILDILNTKPTITKNPLFFELKNKVKNFIERPTVLQALHDALLDKSASSLFSRPFSSPYVAVYGLGGIGKTQLALHYAEQYAENYDNNVLWMNAETKSHLANSFKKLATKLTIETNDSYGEEKEIGVLAEDIYSYFSSQKSLFIFDNAENYQELAAFLPKSQIGHGPTLLITSRYKNWGNIASVVPLAVFTDQEAQAFVKLSLKITANTEDETINKLNRLLDGLPLALQQAVAYIDMQKNLNNNFKISDYLEQYKIEKEKKLFGLMKEKKLLEFVLEHDSDVKTVFTTWQVTLDKIEQDPKAGQTALEILNVMAYLCPTEIENRLFSPFWDRETLSAAIHLLKSYSMIGEGSQQDISTIHPLVQQVTQVHLTQNNNAFEKTAKKIIQILENVSSLYNPETRVSYLRFYYHITRYEELMPALHLQGTQKKIFGNLLNLSYLGNDPSLLLSFFSDPRTRYSQETYLEFLGKTLREYSINERAFLVSNTLDHIRKHWQEKILSSAEVLKITRYQPEINAKGARILRLFASPDAQARQLSTRELVHQFANEIVSFEEGLACTSVSKIQKRNTDAACLLALEQAKFKRTWQHLQKTGQIVSPRPSVMFNKNTLSSLLQGNFNTVAEFLEDIEEASAFSGSFGEAISALAWLGPEIYHAKQQVAAIEKTVQLTPMQAFTEDLRALFHYNVSEYIELKALNNQLVKNAVVLLKQYTDIKRYVFPAACSPTALCQNSEVFLDKKADLNLDESMPDEPSEGNLFCLYGHQPKPPPDRYVNVAPPILPYPPSWLPALATTLIYRCENALGVEYSLNRTGNATLIALAEGDHLAIGSADFPVIFFVNKGKKDYRGGNGGSLFILQSDSITGTLHGGNGTSGIHLENFHPKNSRYILVDNQGWVCGKQLSSEITTPQCDSELKLTSIQQIYGRKNKQDVIYLFENVTFVDGYGAEEAQRDHIYITAKSNRNLKMVLRNNTEISFGANARIGTVDYRIPKHEVGETRIRLPFTALTQHRFHFDCSLTDINTLAIRDNKVIFMLFEQPRIFRVVIANSDRKPRRYKETIHYSVCPRNAYYTFQDIEIQLFNENKLYAKQRDNKTLEEIVDTYRNRARHLNMTLSILTQNNEMVLIGYEKHEILLNNPLAKSHLIGNGGENVYVILASTIPRFPLPEVTLYPVKKDFIDTLDLRRIVQQAKDVCHWDDYSLCVVQEGEDLKILVIEQIARDCQPFYSIHSRTIVTIRLKDALAEDDWYQRLDIIFANAAQNIIFDDENWRVSPLPVVLDSDKDILVVEASNVENNPNIIILKRVGHYRFSRDNASNLIISNALDPSTTQLDIYSIVCHRFYHASNWANWRNKLSPTFTFFDQQIVLKNHVEQIDNAQDYSMLTKEYSDQGSQLDKQASRAKRQIDSKEYVTSSATRTIPVIQGLFGWVKEKGRQLFSSLINTLSNPATSPTRDDDAPMTERADPYVKEDIDRWVKENLYSTRQLVSFFRAPEYLNDQQNLINPRLSYQQTRVADIHRPLSCIN